jgi:hypothetical protein
MSDFEWMKERDALCGRQDNSDALEEQARLIVELRKEADMMHSEYKTARARIAELEAALREAYEVYAGSDGFIPETAAEGYQQQIIKQMVDIIGAALAKANTDLRAARAAYLGEKE